MTLVMTCPGLGVDDPTMMDRWCKGWATKNGRRSRPLGVRMELDAIPLIAETIHQIVQSTDEDLIFFGHSEAATAWGYYIQEYGDRPDAPSARRLRSILTGNPTNRVSRLFWATWGKSKTRIITPVSRYDTLDVTRKGDGWANPRGLNLLGMMTAHNNYYSVDLDQPVVLESYTEKSYKRIVVP